MRSIVFTIIALMGYTIALADGFRIEHGPYLQNVTEEKASLFFTTSAPSFAWVEVDADGWESPRRFAQSEGGLLEAYTKRYNVDIYGLETGKEYRYRIVAKEMKEFRPYRITYGDSIATGWESFRTIDRKSKESSFVIVNDGHDDAGKVRTLLERSQLNSADAVIYLGDMTSHIEREDVPYKGFIDLSTELFARNKPFIAVRGNHETRGNMARRYKEYVGTNEGRFYNVYYYGNTALIVLDTGEDKPDSHPVYGGINDFDGYRQEQAQWLQQEIRSKRFRQCSNRIVLMHIPPFVTGNHETEHHGEKELLRLFTPIFNKAGIDLVLSGHTHRQMEMEPDSKERKFPIITNDNRSVVDLKASNEGIELTITDRDGKIKLNKKL